MPYRPRKRGKRGSYQKIERQTILAAAANVLNRGYNIEHAATAAQIKPSTLRTAVRRYLLRGTVLPMKRGRKAKGDFNADVIRFIIDWVDEHDHTTVFDILNAMDADARLKEKIGHHICSCCIHHLFKLISCTNLLTIYFGIRGIE